MDAIQFKQRMAQLPEPKTELKPPHWDYWRSDLWQRAQTQDPKKFWEWPCIFHTMCQNHWPDSIKYEFSEIFKAGVRLYQACLIPHFGPDDPLESIGGIQSSFSMNLIHQAYHLHQWEQATGQRINQLDTIVEFGGGYGAMALLCHRLGFEGKYVIYDLPEFSLLQQYYLSQFGLGNTVEWNPKRKPKDIDLFMALYSLSEVEPKERDDSFLDSAKSCLLLYSGQWEQWDNVNYFQYRMSTKNWRHTELTHLPDAGNYYSIGF